MLDFKQSPEIFSLQLINKKWTIEIIKALITGKKRFSDFLELYPDLSGKILSERLKELHAEELIEKIVLNMIPLKVKYGITPKGRCLDNILFELALFSALYYPKEIFNSAPSKKTIIEWFTKFYDIENSDFVKLREQYRKMK